MAERPSGSFFCEPSASLGSFEPKEPQSMPDVEIEYFVPDPIVADEFGVTPMTIWRWDHSAAQAALGWPEKVNINGHNYRRRAKLEAYKRNVVALALAEREGVRVGGSEATA
jgi:hypothetical protein